MSVQADAQDAVGLDRRTSSSSAPPSMPAGRRFAQASQAGLPRARPQHHDGERLPRRRRRSARAETTGRACRSRTGTASVFGADSVGARQRRHLTAAGALQPHDRRQPRRAPQRARSGVARRRPSLRAASIPALGLNWNPSRAVQLYAGFSEGSRTPTAIELGCANPAQPCKLPNAFAGDPPLKQVVTRTDRGRRARRAGAGDDAGVPASFAPSTATTCCSSAATRPARATSATSARRGARASSSAPRLAPAAGRPTSPGRCSTRGS